MKISEISEQFDDGEEYDEIEGSDMEQEMFGEEKSQGDLSPGAGSFVSARSSLSSSSSSSSSLSSTPSSSCLVSPSLTPLDWRVIGRDIEVRVSFGWLPFTYEEWYGHPPQTNTWAGMAEQGSSLAELVAPHQAGQTRATQFQQELISTPFISKKKIVMRIFRSDADSKDTFTWNLLRLLVPRRRQGWVVNDNNEAKALRLALKVDPGVSSATLQRDSGTIVIIGQDLDPIKCIKSFVRRSGWAQLISVEEVLPDFRSI